MKKYWVRNTYWVDDAHLEAGNPFERVPMFKAADVERWLEEHEDAQEENGLHVCIDTLLEQLRAEKGQP